MEKSTATIQAIELGKLKLSEELAIKISLETGVSAKWLLAGDVGAKPTSDGLFRGDYTKRDFEWARAERSENREGQMTEVSLPWADQARLLSIKAAAEESGNGRLARYRVSRFLDELEKEFGSSKKRFEREAEKAKLWINFESLFDDPDVGYDTPEDGPPMTAYQKEFVPAFIRAYEGLESTVLSTPEAQSARAGNFPPAFVGPDSYPPYSIIEAVASPVTG